MATPLKNIQLPADAIPAFCTKWQVAELSLFGSVLRDDFRPDSDIDILVSFYPEARPTLFDLVYMENELKEIFHRDIDLITRKGIERSRDTVRREAILSTAQIVYASVEEQSTY